MQHETGEGKSFVVCCSFLAPTLHGGMHPSNVLYPVARAALRRTLSQTPNVIRIHLSDLDFDKATKKAMVARLGPDFVVDIQFREAPVAVVAGTAGAGGGTAGPGVGALDRRRSSGTWRETLAPGGCRTYGGRIRSG